MPRLSNFQRFFEMHFIIFKNVHIHAKRHGPKKTDSWIFTIKNDWNQYHRHIFSVYQSNTLFKPEKRKIIKKQMSNNKEKYNEQGTIIFHIGLAVNELQ